MYISIFQEAELQEKKKNFERKKVRIDKSMKNLETQEMTH